MSHNTLSPAVASPGASRSPRRRGKRHASTYPHWFMLPGGVIFVVLFLVPSVIAVYFSLTRWTLFDTEFIGFDNYVQFFSEPALLTGLRNTVIYAALTSGLKVVFGMLLAVLLTSQIV